MKQVMTRIMSMVLAMVMILAITPAVSLATDSETLTVSIATVKASAGETVDVTVALVNNPGISSAKFKVSFDESVLTLNSVMYNTAMGGEFVPPQKLTSPATLTWVNAFGEFSTDATFATLNFTVNESAEAGVTTAIELTYDPNDIYNLAEDNIDTTVVNGGVTVLACIPGDINGDEIVNNKDASRLMQHLADWDVEVNTPTLDVNNDGSINNKDASRLMQYLGEWDVEIYCACGKAADSVCAHSMTATEAKAATCTEDGNLAYWTCSKCNKVYLDANGSSEVKLENTVIESTGHAIVVIPEIPAQVGVAGMTSGLQCSVCGYYEVKPEPTEPLEPEEYSITYYTTNGDTYLAQYLADNNIVLNNPKSYTVDDSIITLEYYVDIPGYTFEGWYDGTGEDAVIVKEIDPSLKKNYTLYAKWTKGTFKVTLSNELDCTRNGTEFTTEYIERTVTDVTALPQNLTREHYVFMGWSNAYGEIVTTIEPGVTDTTVYANWTSERNQTIVNDYLSDGPIIKEDPDAKKYYFTYYLGKMINVPLYVAHDLNYVDKSIVVSQTIEESKVLDTTTAKEYNNSIANATTNSSSWTLSNDWNEVITEVDGKEQTVSDEETVAISTGTSTAYTSTADTFVGTSFDTTNSKKTSSKTVTNNSCTAGIETGVSTDFLGVAKGEVKTSLEATQSNSKEKYKENDTSLSRGAEWNTTTSNSSSSSSSWDQSNSHTMLNEAKDKWELSISKAVGGSDSETKSNTVTRDQSEGYSSSLIINDVEQTVTVQSITTDDPIPGYYRYVCAGDFHVFATVAYDIETGAYTVHNHSVLDDNTRIFLDYSTVYDYSDYNNGVLPFEVPVDIHNYVFDALCMTDGVIVDTETGIVTGYEGEAEHVYIPDYYSFKNDKDGSYTCIKITGIDENVKYDDGSVSGVFVNNKNIKSVKLSKFITEIPEGAFKNCTSLESVEYDKLTSIGKEAFCGCTSLGAFTIDLSVIALGDDAFDNVGSIIVNAVNSSVVSAATTFNVDTLELNLANITDELTAVDLEFNATGEITINGGGKSFVNVGVISKASQTVLNRITFTGNTGTPLTLKSSDVSLIQVSVVDAAGFAMILKEESTAISLTGKNPITVTGDYAILAKGVTLSRASGVAITTNLSVAGGDVYIVGTEDDAVSLKSSGYLTLSESDVIALTETEYNDLLTARKVTFNANEGSVEETERTVVYGQAIGELPVPSRDYYTFNGWYTAAEGGEQVTAETSIVADTTLYAQWTINEVSDWVLASELPEGAELIDERWLYDETTYLLDQTATSIEGYTQYDSRWVVTAQGSKQYASFPSGFNTSHSIYTSMAKSSYIASQTETTLRDVENVHAGYVYWHWMYDCGGANAGDRRIHNQPGYGSYNDYNYKYFGAFLSSTSYTPVTGIDNGSGDIGYMNTGRTSYADSQGSMYWFRFNYYVSYYTDYVKHFDYYKVEYDKDSKTEVTETDDIANIRHQVQYRAK